MPVKGLEMLLGDLTHRLSSPRGSNAKAATRQGIKKGFCAFQWKAGALRLPPGGGY